MVGYRQRNRIAKTPTGNRKGSRVTEITGSLFSCPHSEIKATGRKDFRYCSTAHSAPPHGTRIWQNHLKTRV